jgi:hypothetical protein
MLGVALGRNGEGSMDISFATSHDKLGETVRSWWGYETIQVKDITGPLLPT